jgi:hypothetical protein
MKGFSTHDVVVCKNHMHPLILHCMIDHHLVILPCCIDISFVTSILVQDKGFEVHAVKKRRAVDWRVIVMHAYMHAAALNPPAIAYTPVMLTATDNSRRGSVSS